MGEGVFEATVSKWFVNIGDTVEEDDSLVEVATDKVDSEIPAPASGKILQLLVQEGEVAKIGEAILVLEIEGEGNAEEDSLSEPTPEQNPEPQQSNSTTISSTVSFAVETDQYPGIPHKLSNGVFLSPLVRSIAKQEKLSTEELLQIVPTGLNQRATKSDILSVIQERGVTKETKPNSPATNNKADNVTIIPMDRTRQLIAEHMLHSKQVSPHVTSFHEVDVTPVVQWREKVKHSYEKTYGEKLTYTPIFIEAITQALKEFPMVNISIEKDQIVQKNYFNIGMATALTDGNLIVPVIKNADRLSLSGLAHKVNDLAVRARKKALQPAEIQGGTFTITNVGSFGNLTGTPIINQPEAAILALGTIKKRPAVIETPHGDTIGIRHIMVISLSYDHRAIDGSLGGLFLKRVADILESFAVDRAI